MEISRLAYRGRITFGARQRLFEFPQDELATCTDKIIAESFEVGVAGVFEGALDTVNWYGDAGSALAINKECVGQFHP